MQTGVHNPFYTKNAFLHKKLLHFTAIVTKNALRLTKPQLCLYFT